VRVAGLVLEHGGDAVQVAVALLHDVIEDCGVVDAELERRFGAEVAHAVRALSDVLEGDTPDRKAPWRERKTRFVARIADIDARARLVAACDKLDNLSAIVADLETEGHATLERFTGKPRQIRWYYEEVSALGVDLPPRSPELDDRPTCCGASARLAGALMRRVLLLVLCRFSRPRRLGRSRVEPRGTAPAPSDRRRPVRDAAGGRPARRPVACSIRQRNGHGQVTCAPASGQRCAQVFGIVTQSPLGQNFERTSRTRLTWSR
jgi:hypothetical protein